MKSLILIKNCLQSKRRTATRPELANSIWSNYQVGTAFRHNSSVQLRIKQKNLTVYTMRFKSNKKLASTYSPRFDPSTIGGAGLNCSVRNGKRWSPALLTPWMIPPPNPQWGNLVDYIFWLSFGHLNSFDINVSLFTPTSRCLSEVEETLWLRKTENKNLRALGSLVLLGCIHYCTSTCSLSTS